MDRLNAQAWSLNARVVLPAPRPRVSLPLGVVPGDVAVATSSLLAGRQQGPPPVDDLDR